MDRTDIDTADILRLHEAHLRAWNEYDLGALGEIYDSNCLICDAIHTPRFNGLGEFIDHVLPMLQAYSGFCLKTFDRVVRVEGSSDKSIGWIASRYEIEARQREGVHRRMGRWTEIYEKKGGAWKLVHFHSSEDPRSM